MSALLNFSQRGGADWKEGFLGMHKACAIASAIFCLVVSSGASATPIDCRKAVEADEKAICSDISLVQEDARLDTLLDLTARLVAMGQRGALRDEQRDWLAKRHRCRTNKTCLRDSYDARIRAVEKVFDEIASRGPY